MAEPFTLIGPETSPALFPDYQDLTSQRIADPDVQLTHSLRNKYAELNLTVVPALNAPLLQFAATGNASATLDTETDSIVRWRGYVGPSHRGGQGRLGDRCFFAKYHYRWSGEDFILYVVGNVQYLLKEPGPGEDSLSHCAASDALIKAAVVLLSGDENKFIYVYDNFWTRSRALWEEVQKASWDKVILDEKMKQALKSVTGTFFDSKGVYEKFGVPWKRGLVFHGPAGNGKTISLKALMHTLYSRREPIPTLYVKSAPTSYDIRAVFTQARRMTPCLLVMEDIETIVTLKTRSYFFNEVDGLENNDGILMLASTNYLDRLDPGLSRRPSRFDRKYLFPLPNRHQRTLYARFWRAKILQRSPDSIPFPEKLCPAIADITADFSFAYMQEAFVASLLAIARDGSDGEAGFEGGEGVADSTSPCDSTPDDPRDDLNGYKLWRVIKAQVKALREDMDNAARSLDLGMEDAFAAGDRLDCGRVREALPEPRGDGRRRIVPSESASSGEGSSLPSIHDFSETSRDQSVLGTHREPTEGEMAANGVGKVQRLGEAAFVWESY